MDIRKKKQLFLICGVALLVLIAAVVLVITLSGSAGKQYEKHYQAAETAFREQKYDTALREIDAALNADATEEAYLLLAQIQYAQGDTEAAIQTLYLGYSRVGGDAIAGMLEELKAGSGAENPLPETDAVTVAGRSFARDTVSVVLSGKGLNNADFAALCTLPELENLSVSDNAISDISPVAGLTKLTSLQLSNNAVSDLSALGGLGNLKTLYLDGNPVSDLTPLYSLRGLRTLSLKNVAVTPKALGALEDALPDCSVFSDTDAENVIEFEIGGRIVTSDATELDLSGLGLTDISALGECRDLRKLNLRDNKIDDVSPLAELLDLEELRLWNNEVHDVTPLMSLKKLRYLDLDTNKLTDVTALGYLTGLEELWLNNNELRSFAPLRNLTELKRLGLRSTGLADADLELLYGLTELEELSLEENPDITANKFAELQEKLPGCDIAHSELLWKLKLGGVDYTSDITEIIAPNRGIESLEGLEHFTALATLNIDGNRVADLSPLYGLTSLRTVSVRGNGLAQEEIDALREHLPGCEIISDTETAFDPTAVGRGSAAASAAAGTGSGYAILWREGDPVSAGARRGLAQQAEDLGMNVVYDGAIPESAEDLTAWIAAMRDCGADTVFLVMDDAAMSAVLEQAEELAYGPQFIQVY